MVSLCLYMLGQYLVKRYPCSLTPIFNSIQCSWQSVGTCYLISLCCATNHVLSNSLTSILDHVQQYDINDPQYHPQFIQPLLNAEEPGEQGKLCFIIVFLMIIYLYVCS